jgi:hypothetical protein
LPERSAVEVEARQTKGPRVGRAKEHLSESEEPITLATANVEHPDRLSRSARRVSRKETLELQNEMLARRPSVQERDL